MRVDDQQSPAATTRLAALERIAALTSSDGDDEEVLDALVRAVRDLVPTAHVDLGPDDGDGARPRADGTSVVVPVAATQPPSVLRVHSDGGPGLDGTSAWVPALTAVASAALVARHARAASRRDGLTGLLNRAALDERATEELARAEREEGDLACAVLDLDEFKRINDGLGHLAGDAILRRVADALHAAIRPFDAVARFGGDEFVVLMPGVSREGAPGAARRLLAAVRATLEEDDGRVSASLGVAVREPHMSHVELVGAADDALREAKASGGGRWVVAGVQVGPTGTPDGDLRVAFDGGIRTLFQPVVELDGGALVGLEALSRGPGTLERPDVLLDHARRAGRLIAMDEELHRRAFRCADELGLRSPLSLFVNIEPETLSRIVGADRFWQRTASTFASVSEVTERALLQRPGPLLRGCQRLRDLGWGIALDDLGVDPRALALLPLVAPDVMKLDRSIVQDGASPEALQTLLACSAQAATGGGRILAEGIETDAHRAHARALGATFGQGWLFGHPEPALPERPSSAPVPRGPSPRLTRGMSPFHVIAAESRTARVGEDLLVALQRELGRRAAATGPTALLAHAHGHAVPERARGGAADVARHAGMVVELSVRPVDVGDGDGDGGPHRATLERSEPMCAEWTCVLLTPDAAIAVTARAEPGDEAVWVHAITHDRDLCVAVANALVTRLA